jgi:hypothetical protein
VTLLATPAVRTRAVVLPPTVGPVDAIDAAYLAKYGNIGTLATSPQARAATPRIALASVTPICGTVI